MSVRRYLTPDGRTLHDALAERIRRRRASGPAPSFRFLPGTYFTNRKALYQVVYGYQSLGRSPCGWVVALRTDKVDTDSLGRVPEGAESYLYSIFQWEGLRHPRLALVQPTPLRRALSA
jgi:hypothetical protein